MSITKNVTFAQHYQEDYFLLTKLAEINNLSFSKTLCSCKGKGARAEVGELV